MLDDDRHSRPRILVGVLTFRRPESLDRLLVDLESQIRDLDPPATVLVVDNDPDGSAEPIVSARSHGRVRYAHEPHPGISAARNLALHEANAFDAIVFIDDDETPEAGWLRAIVDTWLTHGSELVAGPVASVLDGPVDPWIVAGGFFERPRRPTGTVIAGGASGNLLVDVRAQRRLDVWFDEDFGLTGGSDTMFTHTLISRGARVVWCDEALAREPVPDRRRTRRWVLQRSLRKGNVWARVKMRLATTRSSRFRVRVDLTMRGGWRLITGLGRFLRGLATRSLQLQARGADQMATGTGVLLGVIGYVHTEYRRARQA